VVSKSHILLENGTTSECHSLHMLKFVMWFWSFSLDHSLKKNMEIKLEMVLDLQLQNVQHDPFLALKVYNKVKAHNIIPKLLVQSPFLESKSNEFFCQNI
jgi:hypothetical protein